MIHGNDYTRWSVVTTEHLLQDGGAYEYVCRDRTGWRCAVFVGKIYGSKGYPQRNAAHVRWTLPVTSSNSLKQHLSGERFPDDDAVERAVCAWSRQQPQEFYAAGFQGQVFRFVWRLRWKINVVCMSLSPFVSFQSRFVTYWLSLVHCSKGMVTGGQHKTPPPADFFTNPNIVNYIPAYKTMFRKDIKPKLYFLEFNSIMSDEYCTQHNFLLPFCS